MIIDRPPHFFGVLSPLILCFRWPLPLQMRRTVEAIKWIEYRQRSYLKIRHNLSWAKGKKKERERQCQPGLYHYRWMWTIPTLPPDATMVTRRKSLALLLPIVMLPNCRHLLLLHGTSAWSACYHLVLPLVPLNRIIIHLVPCAWTPWRRWIINIRCYVQHDTVITTFASRASNLSLARPRMTMKWRLMAMLMLKSFCIAPIAEPIWVVPFVTLCCCVKSIPSRG